MKTTSLVIACCLLATGAFGQVGSLPEVGAEVPEISLETIAGEAVSLSEQVGDGPVVLVFFRGAW